MFLMKDRTGVSQFSQAAVTNNPALQGGYIHQQMAWNAHRRRGQMESNQE